MSSKIQDLATHMLADWAVEMAVTPEELGREWVEFAEAVAGHVLNHKCGDPETIGRLCKAAVELP